MRDLSKFSSIIAFLSIFFYFFSSAAAFDKPITTDSRIRTFVYSEHEVFRVVVHYGYQTNIEFADGEEVQTISVGNNYAWQLSPLGRRLFIKPLEENISTNMTLITNKRTYQFELQSRDIGGFVDDELVYVVRFFYPDEYTAELDADTVDNDTNITVDDGDSIPTVQTYNFDYEIIGPKSLAPLKVFDDGINTYFQFPQDLKDVPIIKDKNASKNGVYTNLKKIKDYILVNAISKSFSIILKNQKVDVINNKLAVQKK